MKTDFFKEIFENTVFLGIENKFAGAIFFKDKIKEEAREIVKKLKELDKKIYLLTGDNERVAKEVGEILGIENIFYRVLPEEKLKIVKSLKEKNEVVCFVGDGINDAPALAEADLGIAMGKGRDIAIEAGDIILIKDDLRDILKAVEISKLTMKKIKENLFWAFFYNLICIPIAGGILYPFYGILLNPIIAGFAMSFSSLSVVINSLTLKKIVL